MRPFHVLVVCGLVVLLGGSAHAGKDIETTKVTAALRQRLEADGFTLTTRVRGTHIGFAAGSNGYQGRFRLGEAREVEVPKYKSVAGQWKGDGTAKPKVEPAQVTFQIGHIDPRKKLPLSLKEVVRRPRKAIGKEVKLGKAPRTDLVKHPGQWTETYSSEVRDGADVERLVVTSTAPGRRIVGSADRKSLTAVEPWPAPLEVRTKILYHYKAERFGQEIDKILMVRIRVTNAPGSRIPLEPIDYKAMETAVFWAIADVAGRRPHGKRPPSVVPPEAPPPDPDPPIEPSSVPSADPPPDDPEPPREQSAVVRGYPDVIGVFVQAGEFEADLVEIQAQLRAGVVAQAEEQALLDNLRRTLELMDADDAHRAEYEEWIEELDATIAGLEQEREDKLREARLGWDTLRRRLDDVIGMRDGQPRIQRELEAFRSELELKEQLSELNVLLAAGRTDDFNAKLPGALKNKRIAEGAMKLRVADYLERGKIAEALYAAREGARRHPDSKAFPRFLLDFESRYLQTIAEKAAGDGARLHTLWEGYAGEDHGMLWSAFFGGLKHVVHGVTGTRARLEQVLGTGMDRAAMEHNGIEMMRRLRGQGLSFEEIEKLDFYDLREWMIKLAPDRGPPTDRSVQNFEVALGVAFQNEDVKRLRAPGKALMAVSTRSYYGAEEFDDHWGGLLDAISAKNVLLIFGPAATLGVPGWLARFATRMGAPGRIVRAAASHRGAAMTSSEFLYSSRSAQQVARAIANSRAGPTLANARHAVAALRYNEKYILLRGSTATAGFMAQVGGHWLLMEGAGWAGEKLGGEYGRIAGELMSGFVGMPGVGSTARLNARAEHTEAVLKQARNQAKAMEGILKGLRAPVHEAAESLAHGRALSMTAREALERAAVAAEDAAERAYRVAARGGSRLVQGTADEAQALAASARASLAGHADDALGASQAARVIDDQVQAVKRSVEAAEKRLAKIQQSPTLTMERGARRARAPGSKTRIHGDPVPPRKSIPRVGGKPSTAPPSAPALPLGEIEKSALELMRQGKFKDAVAVLHVALRHPKAKATVIIERLKASLKEAAGAERARRTFANWRRSAMRQRLAGQADEAKVAFTRAEREAIEASTKLLRVREMEALPGVGGAKLIRDKFGNPVAVWKPGTRATPALVRDGQIAAEVLNSRLGRRLGLRVPHAEPLMIEGQRGVLVRWIPGTTPLKDMSRGARAALKDQVAAFRPLHTAMGNYDLHLGNYVVDRAGRVWAIDAGQSLMTTPPYKLAVELAARKAIYPIHGDADEVINWTRWLRDWYKVRGAQQGGSVSARRMHTLASGKDMQQSALGMQRVTAKQLEADIAAAVAGAPKSAKRAEDILNTLLQRQKNLKRLLDEHWQGALR